MPTPVDVSRVRSAVLLVGCLVIAGCARHDTVVAVAPAIDELLQHEMAAAHLPGLAVGVVQKGEVTYRRVAGVADRRSQAAVTADTPFPLASMARSMSAVGVLRLVQQGQLRLDDALGTVLPDLPPTWQAVTVRQVLSHTSGLPDVDGQANDGLVARIVERVSGQAFETYMAEKIFAPLGMEATFFADGARPCATSDDATGGSVRTGLCSSLNDLVTWSRALVIGAALDPGLRDQMWNGLGWTRDGAPGRRSVGQSGKAAAFRRYLDEDMTIIVLHNGVRDPDALVAAIASLLRGETAP